MEFDDINTEAKSNKFIDKYFSSGVEFANYSTFRKIRSVFAVVGLVLISLITFIVSIFSLIAYSHLIPWKIVGILFVAGIIGTAIYNYLEDGRIG